MHPTCLWIYQVSQPGFFSIFPYYLPGPVTVDTKEKLLAILGHWSAVVDILPNHLQGVSVYRQSSKPAMLPLLSHYLCHFKTASGAELM